MSKSIRFNSQISNFPFFSISNVDGIYLWKIVIIVVEGFAATAYQQIKQESLFKLAQFYTNPSLQVCHSYLHSKFSWNKNDLCKISSFISEFHNQRILNHEWWWLLGGEVLRNIYSILHVFQQEFTNRSDQSLAIQIHKVLIRKFKHEFWGSFFRVKSLHKKPGLHTLKWTISQFKILIFRQV